MATRCTKGHKGELCLMLLLVNFVTFVAGMINQSMGRLMNRLDACSPFGVAS